MIRSLSVMLLSLLVSAAPLRAAEIKPVEVRPGAVATLVAFLPTRAPAAAHASARFSIQPAEGVRLLGASTGVLPWSGAEPRRLPVAFTVGADAPAGEMVAGRVRVEWADGRAVETELRVRVGVARRLTLEAQASRSVVRPGESVRVTYRVTNRGNASDTVHLEALAGTAWKVSPTSESRVLAPGGMATGQFDVVAPRTAPLGEQRLVQLRALGRGGEEKLSLALLVAEDDANRLGLAQIPGTLFVGSSTAGGYNLAFSGRGAIGPETEVSVAFRRIGSLGGQVFGPSDLWGPRALLLVRHRAMQAELGEVSLPGEGIMTGMHVAGRGLHAGAKKGDLTGGFFAARPSSLGQPSGGLLLQGELGYALPLGTVSARMSDFDWGTGGMFGRNRVQFAGLGYRLADHGPHRLLAEVGIGREVVGNQGSAPGLALDASYSYTVQTASLTAQVRSTPEQLAGGFGAAHSASINGGVALADAVRVNASAFWNAREGQEGRRGGSGQGVSAGVAVSGLGSSLGVSLNRRESEGRTVLGGAEARTTVTGSVSTAVGPLSLRASAEAGQAVVADGDAYDLRRVQGQLRWSQPGKSAWIGVHYADERLFRSPLQAELGTDLRLGGLSLSAAAGANVAEAGLQGGYLKAGVEAHVTPTLSLVAGAEHSAAMLSANPAPWTLSLGIRKALPLPLPVKEVPKVAGVVFEDGNGNGKQDRGEPGIAGVAVTIGPLRAVTDDKGRFGFIQAVAAGLPLRLDAATLGDGLLAPFTETLVGGGRIQMPVERTAGLELLVVEDRDGEGTRGQGEPAVSGATVVLRSVFGREYPQLTDEQGRARFAVLPAGRYEASIHRPGQEPHTFPLQLAPGASLSKEVALPVQARGIRMWSNTGATK